MTEERRSQWNFQSSEAGWAWSVTRADGSRQASSRTFSTLKECADDAMQHGYIAWKAEEERRRDLMLGVRKALRREAQRE